MEITTPHVAMDDESSSVIADAGKACGLLRPQDEFTKEVGAANS